MKVGTVLQDLSVILVDDWQIGLNRLRKFALNFYVCINRQSPRHITAMQSYVRHFASTTKNIGRHLTAFLSLVSRMENDFYNKTTAAPPFPPSFPFSPLKQQSIYPLLPSLSSRLPQSMTATITPLARQNVSYFGGQTDADGQTGADADGGSSAKATPSAMLARAP